MVVLPLRTKFLTTGHVALTAIVLMTAAILVFGPSGSARPVGIVAAVAVVAGGVWILRGVRRQAVVLDGERLGWRGGMTGKVIGWTDISDVETVSVANLSTSVNRTRSDVILWARDGGLRGPRAWLLRLQRPRRATSDRSRHDATTAALHPFIVPLTALNDADRELIERLLRGHGIAVG